MKQADLKLLKNYFQELQHQTDDCLHQRIINAAIDGGDDCLQSMENELGSYLKEVLNDEN